jgi:hypothetical protein
MTVAHLTRNLSTQEWLDWAALYEVEADERKREERRQKAAQPRRRR